MTLQKIRAGFRKNWFSYLLFAVMLVFIFNRDAKSWLLRQVLRTGFFDAKIEKQDSRLVGTTDTVDFSLRDSQGRFFSIAEQRGKVVFINFWASWCPPCRAEFSSLESFYRKVKDNPDIVFVTVNEDDSTVIARRFLDQHHYTVPVYFRAGEIPADVFSGTLPTTVVLDKRGVVRLKEEGMANYDTKKFEDQLTALIRE